MMKKMKKMNVLNYQVTCFTSDNKKYNLYVIKISNEMVIFVPLENISLPLVTSKEYLI